MFSFVYGINRVEEAISRSGELMQLWVVSVFSEKIYKLLGYQ